MIRSVICASVSTCQAQSLTLSVSSEEIRTTIFEMGRHKAPGSDGYTVELFRSSLDTVGDEVIVTVSNFFERGRLLREANTTIILLISTKANPSTLSDFRRQIRLSSCCNTVYKSITCILASRISDVLPGLIGSEQSAFILGH